MTRLFAAIALLWAAALVGFGATFFAVESSNAETQTVPETQRIIVANRSLRFGHELKPEDLRWLEWPKASLPDGVFTSRAELFGESGDESRRVLRRIEKDEPILKAKVSGFGKSARLAAQLSEGMRAYALQFKSSFGVAGFIEAGDRVDVILTRQIDGNMVSGVIIRDLLVIAVDQNLDQEANRPRLSSATVEVDSRQAQKLTLAQQVGSLTLTFREASEESTDKIGPVDLGDIEFNVDRPQTGNGELGPKLDAWMCRPYGPEWGCWELREHATPLNRGDSLVFRRLVAPVGPGESSEQAAERKRTMLEELESERARRREELELLRRQETDSRD